MNDPKGPLEPARYEEAPDEGFAAPPAPWKIGLVIVGVLALLVGGYTVRKRMRLAELRTSLKAEYAERIFPSSGLVAGFRNRIDGWVTEAARAPVTETYVAEGFSIADLRDVPGTYLRVAEADAASLATIDTAAREVEPDAIGRCLGIAPMSVRPLYDRSSFLQAAWIDRVQDIDDVLRLRVIQDELERHATRDLPVLEELAESRFFMLLLTRGETRHAHPVDVYVWTLGAVEPTLVLRTRTQAMGVLITARNAVGGAAGAAPAASARHFSGAADCSIAAQIRAAVEGSAPVTVQSVAVGAPEAGAEEGPEAGVGAGIGAEAGVASGAP